MSWRKVSLHFRFVYKHESTSIFASHACKSCALLQAVNAARGYWRASTDGLPARNMGLIVRCTRLPKHTHNWLTAKICRRRVYSSAA